MTDYPVIYEKANDGRDCHRVTHLGQGNTRVAAGQTRRDRLG